MNEPRRAAADRALLRRFEPVVRYTRGERFFPMRVDPYVRDSSLWVGYADGSGDLLVEQGALTLEELGQSRRAPYGAVHFLQFIEPLNVAEMAAYQVQRVQKNLAHEREERRFRAGRARLARVGFGSRLLDALFSLTLLARGRVSGDTAAAASVAYSGIMQSDPHTVYYGRVIRQGGWVICQYWYFYAFNNWRSGFYGANDHEGDWEMACVYLSQPAGAGLLADDVGPDERLQPVWVAYAAHDYQGDDLRRRWDDPQLEREGEHPVIYAGAGSHASYFEPGEYLAELEIPILLPLVRIVDRMQIAWDRMLRRYQFREESDVRTPGFNVFRIPFVDYARGDGEVVGCGHPRTWDEPELLVPVPEWVMRYRGLWGLYTRDPLAGENAPAGPRFNRDGTVRKAWYDPLGWVGLDKIPPLNEMLARVQSERDALLARQLELDTQIEVTNRRLVGLGVQVDAMRNLPHLEAARAADRTRLDALAAEVDALRVERAENDARIDALAAYAERLQAGELGPPRLHIRRDHRPTESSGRFSRVAEGWAAISIGLFLIAFVLLFLLAPDYIEAGLGVLIGGLLVIEATFRRQLARLITGVTVFLAIVAALVLIFEFFWELVVFAVLTAGAFLIWDNLRELFH